MSHLNGWLRLWCVLSFFSLLFALVFVIETDFEYFIETITAGIGFPIFVLAMGYAVAWVRRGFKQK